MLHCIVRFFLATMENLHSLDLFESTNFGYEEKTQVPEEVDEDCEVLAEEPKKKRQKKSKAKQIKVEEDDNKRNWLDSKVEALIGLKGEMQPDFIKNTKKQGMQKTTCDSRI